MNNFKYSLSTEIYFGKKQEEKLPEILKAFGATNILIHYGSGSIKKSGLYAKITKALTDSNFKFCELGGVVPNPRISLAYQGIEICREKGCDFILAIGGGSVIDSAKTISIGAGYEGDVWDFFSKRVNFSHKFIPVGVVLTIPAAGSETSNSMVITKDEGGLKRSYGNDKIRPAFAIMNPEFCFTLPKNQIANGVSDILAHLMERYFTNTKNVALTDNMLEAVMRTVIDFGEKVFKQPDNYDFWAEVMWAGSIAHNGILDTGRVGDWASHGLEHELSGLYDVAHGAGLAVVFPAWMKYVYKHDLSRFERFAREVFGITKKEDAALSGIRALENFYKRLELPVTGKELGADKKDNKYLAKMAFSGGRHGNFVSLNLSDIENIYDLMY